MFSKVRDHDLKCLILSTCQNTVICNVYKLGKLLLPWSQCLGFCFTALHGKSALSANQAVPHHTAIVQRQSFRNLISLLIYLFIFVPCQSCKRFSPYQSRLELDLWLTFLTANGDEVATLVYGCDLWTLMVTWKMGVDLVILLRNISFE